MVARMTTLDLRLTINGAPIRACVPACTTLLEVLRDVADLTGAKRGCDLGACGACTVLVDGRRIYACVTLAAMHERRAIVTIEGTGGRRHDASAPARLHRARRTAMRLLHAGPDRVGRRLHRRRPCDGRARDRRSNERQSVPLSAPIPTSSRPSQPWQGR
jgi:hypothetical protein